MERGGAENEQPAGLGAGNAGSNNSDAVEQFDITLPASHSYMGDTLVRVPGRRVLEGGWTGRVPVMAHHGAVFPGETVPMLVSQPHDVILLSRAIRRDKLFGLLCPNETGTVVSGYGAVCEVFEATSGGEEEATLSFKARATHRFRLKRMPKRNLPAHFFSRMRLIKIVVLGEVTLGDPLRPARLASLDPLRRAREPLDVRLRGMDAAVTPWPLFVYDMFDLERLRRRIKEYFSTIAFERIPEEPTSLSFWVASNLPLSSRDRLALLATDNVLHRLHLEERLIARRGALGCLACGADIARRDHILPMSSEGVHSNYSNLGGYMHDIVTLSRATHVTPSGAPSAEYTWFPGYTWTIMLCAACNTHVGWRFDAIKHNLVPQQFYGLCRNYVQPRDDDTPRSNSPLTIDVRR